MKQGVISWGILSKHRNTLYGIAALSIIIYLYTSIYSFYPEHTRPFWATSFFQIVSSIGVEIFLFLAGVFCFFSYKKAESYKEYFLRRLKKVLTPYIIIGLFFWGIEYLFLYKDGVFEFLQDFTFVTYFTKGEGPFWFIIVIILFYSIYPIIHHFFFSSGNSTIRLLCLEVGIIIILFFIKDTVVFRCIQTSITRIPIFILGCYYGKRVDDEYKVNIVEIVIAIIGIVLKIASMTMELDMLSLRLVSVFFAYACCLFVCLLVEKIGKKEKSKCNFLDFCGTRSLELYLANVAIIKLFIDFGIVAVNYSAYFLVVILCFGVALILPYLSRVLIDKFVVFSKCQNWGWFVFLFALLFRMMLNLDLQTITIPSDEFNTVSVAAQIMGLNWGNVNASNGYYGYSAIILYLPAFFFHNWFKDPYLIYQSILFANSLMCALYTVVTYKVLIMIGKEHVSTKTAAVLALIASFVPQLFGVGQLAHNESIYSFCHMMVIYMLMLSANTHSELHKILFSNACAFFAVFALAGNNRGIVIVIATVLTIFVALICLKKCIVDLIAFGIAFIGTLVLHYKVLYPYFRSYFPTDAYNTDANLIFERIPRILSNWEDMKAILVAGMSWVYTFITSTYGLGIIIIGILLYYVLRFGKAKTIFSANENIVNTILVLWFIGTTCLCIINFLDSIQGILQYNQEVAYNPTRVDKLFYFRYYIALAPFAMSYGILLFKKYSIERCKAFVISISYLFVGVVLFFHSYITANINGMSYATSSTNLIGLFLGEWTADYKYGTAYAGRFFVLTVVAIIVLSTFFWFIYKKRYNIWLKIFLLLEIVTCVVYSGLYMAPRTDTWKNYVDEEIIEIIAENEVHELFVQRTGQAFLYQFLMPDIAVYTTFENQEVVMLKTGSKRERELAQNYQLLYSNESNSLWVVK